MPKPVKKAKRPSSDPNRRAHQLMQEHLERAGAMTTEPHGDTFEDQFRARMAELGRKGGKVSGARRMKNLTDEQRQEIAARAARARWRQIKGR
jgi:general stress protein YciG